MPNTLTRWDRFALIAILLIGAGLRFQQLGDIEYNIDQAYSFTSARRARLSFS